MSDILNEQLSAMVDDELDDLELLVGRLKKDTELKARWSRYHTIRDAMTDHITLASVDISGRVSQALESEPAILAPVKHKRSKRVQFMAKQAVGLAIAATVSAVAVLTVQQYNKEEAAPTQVAVKQPVTPSAPVRLVSDSQKLDSAVQSKLSNYLVNHNEYSASSNMQGVMPYMRIVGVAPGERVELKGANDQ